MIKFASGKQLISPKAKERLLYFRQSSFALLHRHFSADWGVVPDAQRVELQKHLQEGFGSLVSIFLIEGEAIFYYTVADRSLTFICVPDEVSRLLAPEVTGGFEELPLIVPITVPTH